MSRGRQAVQLQKKSVEKSVQLFHCAGCLKEVETFLQCTRCKVERYCCKACQVSHWPSHKKQCKEWANAIKIREKTMEMLLEGSDATTDGCSGCSGKPTTIAAYKKKKEQEQEAKRKQQEQDAKNAEATRQGLAAETLRLKELLRVKHDAAEIEAQRTGVAGTSGVKYAVGKSGGGDPAIAKEVVELYWNLAEAGEAQAQYTLGMLYRQGDGGLARDPQEAMKWLHKAAVQGHAKAQCKVGVMYGKGEGTKKDRKQAMEWFTKAASNGFHEAQLILDKLVPNQPQVVVSTSAGSTEEIKSGAVKDSEQKAERRNRRRSRQQEGAAPEQAPQGLELQHLLNSGQVQAPTTSGPTATCSECSNDVPISGFSAAQKKKKAGRRRCKICVGAEC